MSREVNKITSRNSYKACVLSKVFLTQELSRTTNDVLLFKKKKAFFFPFMIIYIQTKKYLRAIITTTRILQLYYSGTK